MDLHNIVTLFNDLTPPVLLAGGLLLGLLAASLIWWAVLRRVRQRTFELGLQHHAVQQTQERAELLGRIDDAQDALRLAEQQQAQHQALLGAAEQQLADVRHELEQKREALSGALTEVAATTARMEESKRSFAEKEQLFKESTAQMQGEFEKLANRVFEHQGARQQTSLQNVLTPFKDQIIDFKKKVEEVYHSDIKERASLLTEVRNLQAASERINEEAENLTRALKGDKKLQGNWGELVLERVLEESGLRKDHEYFLQSSRRTASGEIKRPDVLIRLPDEKDVVIDAKVSLNAYEEALSCEDDQQRETLLRTHLANLRSHVKRLSEQDYDQLPDVRSLDFVLMFVPIESAFTLAMETDQRLFTEAFNQRIVIVSPTTLMMTLRIINNVWRYEKQNRNAQEIAQRAGALYDKLRVLVDDMETLGKQLATADKTYQAVYAKLATGKANLVRQVEKFRELGAQVKKPMPAALVERAADEDA